MQNMQTYAALFCVVDGDTEFSLFEKNVSGRPTAFYWKAHFTDCWVFTELLSDFSEGNKASWGQGEVTGWTNSTFLFDVGGDHLIRSLWVLIFTGQQSVQNSGLGI